MDLAVGLARSYLELCGYFVLAELPVRTPAGQGYRDVTDLDVIAVRFPHDPLPLSRRKARPLEIFLGTDPTLDLLEDGIDLLICEVKEGRARLNPALRRAATISFALRRTGCCPEPMIPEVARTIAREGWARMTMPGGMTCRVRLVAFAGHGVAAEPGVRTVALRHCVAFITTRLNEARDVLAGVQFKDPILGWFTLQEKLS